MKKMTKGAIVTGLGVALLLGGGGTLATWNAEQTASAGVITAGNLTMDSDGGTWTSTRNNEVVDIETHRIVPGETLVFNQELNTTVEGDGMQSFLQVEGLADNKGFGNSVTFADYKLSVIDGKKNTDLVLTESNAAGTYLEAQVPVGTKKLAATAKVTFSPNAKNDTMEAEYDLSTIKFNLVQRLSN